MASICIKLLDIIRLHNQNAEGSDPMPARRRSPPKYRAPRNDMSYMVRGMTDMSKMAVAGTVMVGTIGTVGSLFKK
jgi:hypothetical protein